MIKTKPMRTSQRRIPYLAMVVYGDTMHGVHITIGWRHGDDKRDADVMTYTVPEMLRKLYGRIERYLR
jgi:hypothetical protein